MATSHEIRSTGYQCLFCGENIASGALDPCALNLVAAIDRPRLEQKEQTFYCHIACLQAHASSHPGCFYITDPEFPTLGEIESEP
jgi:hypothetical protein